MEKNIEMSILFELYGNILTAKQKQIIEDYYNNDLSLAEIGQNLNITRQAVRDNLKNAEKRLYDMEENLKLMQKQKDQDKALEEVLAELQKIKSKNKQEDIKKEINSTIEKINVILDI